MRVAIISDTHLGDDHCTLVARNGDTLLEGTKYRPFVAAAGEGNDYLVLLGDILDFSIASYEDAYRYGRFFFQRIKDQNIAKEIIYVAGNHDADIWHIIQHQRSVINRIRDGKLPAEYDHSIAGIIDDRQNSPLKRIILDKVAAREETGKPNYGGMFLDAITNPAIPFNFAYPNLYMVTDTETVLLTHGQYLEPYWAITGEIALKIAYDDLRVGEVDVEEMVEMNFPLNQLACTGIGQAGVLTRVARQVEIDARSGNLKRIEKYLNRLEKHIDELTDFNWLKEIVVDYMVRKAKEEFLDSIKGVEQTRYSEEFIYKKEVRERFRRFYAASLLEVGSINTKLHFSKPGLAIPAPWRVVFGHTHQPISWDDPDAPKMDSVSSSAPRRLTLHNTGGWLMEGERFCGAEVFRYETGKGFWSAPVR